MKTQIQHPSYDVAVIGAGAAGITVAQLCARQGLQTILMDPSRDGKGNPLAGGTSLLNGCIPAKILLQLSHEYHQLQQGRPGLKANGLALDLAGAHAHIDNTVRRISDQITASLRSGGVEYICANGRLLKGKQVEITALNHEPAIIQAEHIVLASGSHSMTLSSLPLDGGYIVDPIDALRFEQVPKTLTVIGAGAIGLEIAGIWSRFGSQVTVLDAQDSLLPFADQDIANEMLACYSRQGVDIRLQAWVKQAEIGDEGVTLTYQHPDQPPAELYGDKVVVAIGRIPNTETLFAPEVDVVLDENGYVHVDEQCMTNLPEIFAVGDLVLGPMMAHKGIAEARVVADTIAGKSARMEYANLPSVIYTLPEVAWIGRTEAALAAAGVPYKISITPFADNPKALVHGFEEGFIKILAHAETDRILGIHMIGPQATELIAEAVLAMEYSASSEDLADTIHAYPSLSDVLRQAALMLQE
ncbi:MAG: hypothetical protein AXA67_04735 [Methylothermaceae bacteria B42]|nr:MAG: hypothetical protein AXA67_04735 [Methylothermaceae bacteria B42]HHJ39993.1 dihydrolipoyl dehydrogenase [Methylothermaceae bacterium]